MHLKLFQTNILSFFKPVKMLQATAEKGLSADSSSHPWKSTPKLRPASGSGDPMF